MKLNFTVQLEEFEPVFDENKQPVLINKTFATLLGRDSHVNSGIDYMDAIQWAIAINNGADLDLSTKEQELLKDFIKTNTALTVFAKNSLLKVFDKKE